MMKKNNNREDHSTPTVFLDLIKAFDRVDHRILLYRLCQYGVTGPLWKWIRSLLEKRKFNVRHNGLFSIECDLLRGVPQGSVLAPLLFSIFINPLGLLLRRHCKNISVRFLADDVAMTPLLTGTRGYEELQKSLSISSLWAQNNGMEFSPRKSAIVLFSPFINKKQTQEANKNIFRNISNSKKN
jgi:hypothetical protein